MQDTAVSDAGKLEGSHENRQMFEWSPDGDVGDAGMGERRSGQRGRARGLRQGKESRKRR